MISVIIPTRNRAKLLSLTLASIVKQELSPALYEVLVIDNGSTDETQKIIEQFQPKIKNLSGIYAPKPGLHTGRHMGMKAAQGEILVFADDDIEALPTWLSAIESVFKDPTVAMVGGNNYPMFLETPPRWLKRLWNRPTMRGYKAIPSLSVIEFNHPEREISPYLVWGCNFAIRKELLLEAGGFHPDGMPKELIRFRGDGETHVCRYVSDNGLKCVFHPEASVYHKVTPERMSHDYFRQRGFNQGVSDSYSQQRQEPLSKKSKKHFILKRGLNFAIRKIFHMLSSKETKLAETQLKLGYREGFNYHQTKYRSDPDVRNWVHRHNYF